MVEPQLKHKNLLGCWKEENFLLILEFLWYIQGADYSEKC